MTGRPTGWLLCPEMWKFTFAHSLETDAAAFEQKLFKWTYSEHRDAMNRAKHDTAMPCKKKKHTK